MSSPILIYQPGGGVSDGSISNPPVYSQADTTALVEGQAYIDIVFGSVQTDDEWVLVGCIVSNEIDVDPLNIWPGIITERSSAGFRIYFNGMPDSGNYYLHWSVSGINIEPSAASTYTLSSSGVLVDGVVTFTVALPPSTFVTGSVIVIPSEELESGVFSPDFVTLTTSSRTQNFTFTPSVYGDATIQTTNDGGLIDPAAVDITIPVPSYTLIGPSGGEATEESTPFTVELVGEVIGPVTVTPDDGGVGGTFTPTTVMLTEEAPSEAFTYTPVTTGDIEISTTNDGGLPDPDPLTYTATVPAPHLLDTLISYWKLDEASNVTRNDSHGTNHLTDNGNVGATAGMINNAIYVSASPGVYLSHASNASLQVTGDFTFSFWARVDTPSTTGIILGKINAAITLEEFLILHGTPGFQFSIGGVAIATGTSESAFSWHHVVAWYDSSDQKLRLRLDNATTYTSAATATLFTATDPFAIGATSYGNLPWNGQVDELGFWKRKLTPEEITALYNAGAGLPYGSFTA